MEHEECSSAARVLRGKREREKLHVHTHTTMMTLNEGVELTQGQLFTTTEGSQVSTSTYTTIELILDNVKEKYREHSCSRK